MREILYLKFKKSSCLPNYYGIRMTNYGLAYITDYIVNEDGSPCADLCQLLAKPSDSETEHVIRSIESFRNTLINDSIVCLELFPHNLALKRYKDGTYNIYIVDLGDSSRIPQMDYISSSVRVRRMRKRWIDFVLILLRTCSEDNLSAVRHLLN